MYRLTNPAARLADTLRAFGRVPVAPTRAALLNEAERLEVWLCTPDEGRKALPAVADAIFRDIRAVHGDPGAWADCDAEAANLYGRGE